MKKKIFSPEDINKLLAHSVIKNITNEGSLGKTMIAAVEAGIVRRKEIPVALFACDHARQDLVTSYGSRTKGELDEVQDPSNGVLFIDSRYYADELIDNLDKYDTLIIEDHKADSLDEQNAKHKSPAAFVRDYETSDKILWYFVPVATNPKSIDSLNVVANTFRGININRTVQFVFVLNKGLMHAQGGDRQIAEVMKAYNECEAVKEMIASGNAYEIIIDDQLSVEAATIVKTNSLDQIIAMKKAKQIGKFDYGTIMGLFETFEEQFFGVFKTYLERHGLPFADTEEE